MSVFARWVFPESGFEAYVEWARMEAPRSLRDFATAPQHTQGYTLGVQWARRLAIPASLRLQSEFTYLEQTATFAERPPPSFYTGRATVHGFTHRGQVLGAMIGPGASSQWLAADLLWPAWQAGAFVGRVRTENDVMYRLVRPSPARHDVTLYGGVRGGLLHRLGDVAAELTVGRRHNYLFQNDGYNPGDRVRAIDVRNVTLELTVTPR